MAFLEGVAIGAGVILGVTLAPLLLVLAIWGVFLVVYGFCAVIDWMRGVK